jgi:hypothetical protein
VQFASLLWNEAGCSHMRAMRAKLSVCPCVRSLLEYPSHRALERAKELMGYVFCLIMHKSLSCCSCCRRTHKRIVSLGMELAGLALWSTPVQPRLELVEIYLVSPEPIPHFSQVDSHIIDYTAPNTPQEARCGSSVEEHLAAVQRDGGSIPSRISFTRIGMVVQFHLASLL